jgi:hypothetical protein
MLRTIVHLVTFTTLCGAAAADELTPKSFASIKAKIVPSAEEEGFLAIPWRAALWPALAEARAADRPVLLWVMNGHPLGCT